MATGRDLGREPTFSGVADALKRRLRVGRLGQQSRIGQLVKSAGLRTSGVGQIPLIEAERTRQSQEAGIEGQLGSQRLGQLGSLEQIKLQGTIQERLGRLRGDRAGDIARTRARESLRNALIGSGLGLIGSRFGGGRKASRTGTIV